MVSKVNGIKIFPKHSLGCILSASFGVFIGFMLLLGLNFFPLFKATVNVSVMQVNAFDYFCKVIGDKIEFIENIQPLSKVTHVFAPNKYNLELLEYFKEFRHFDADSINYAVFWYAETNAWLVFDYVIAISYLLIMPFALALFIEGIIRLATGTYHKNAKSFTIVCSVLTLILMVATFFTDFCTKYLAKSSIGEGESYVSNACPMKYVLFILCILCCVGQHIVYSSMIKGKLYVADGRLIRKSKNKDNDTEDEPKKKRKQKETTPVEEVPVVEEVAPVEDEVPVEPSGAEKEPMKEEVNADAPAEENPSSDSEANEPKSE